MFWIGDQLACGGLAFLGVGRRLPLLVSLVLSTLPKRSPLVGTLRRSLSWPKMKRSLSIVGRWRVVGLLRDKQGLLKEEHRMSGTFGKGSPSAFLIDGSAFIFRAYHALPPLTRNQDGLRSEPLAGFCNTDSQRLCEGNHRGRCANPCGRDL